MRAERIELSSLAWKAGILAIIRRPHAFKLYQILAYNRKHKKDNDVYHSVDPMNLNKFTNNIDDPLHTSVFAAAAKSSGGMGANGPQSFERRLHIERNRRNVNRYHDSMVANYHHRESDSRRISPSVERPDITPDQQTGRGGITPRRINGGLSPGVVTPTMRPRFTEPPTRGYNPYK